MPSKIRTEQRRQYERAWKKRRRDEYIAAKYGPDAVTQNMSGRHGNQAKGFANGRWSGNRRITPEGYAVVHVSLDHPHGWGPKRLRYFRYAYEHHVVAMEMIGRPLRNDEVVHHRNGRRDDNRPENLEITTRSSHAREHTSMLGVRDAFGRFNNKPRHYPSDREFPK